MKLCLLSALFPFATLTALAADDPYAASLFQKNCATCAGARGYSTADGKILWDYDTAREFKTVNGVPGHGGAMDVGGPIVAGGMLFVSSGYARRSLMPGNVLLAFGVER